MTEPDSIEPFKAALADRYVIERELGHGGMSIVYLARDLKIERRVALKVLRPELAASVGSERFLREIRIAARLQHPHILALHDSGEAAGRIYYVMPFVEGESLRDRITKQRQLPLDEALRITREVAEGLHYAHTHGVVHRDIKPENILLAGDHALIADFGVARALAGDDGTTSTGYVVGTPLYMSPEQAGGDELIDARSDIYSLACVLYEMLTGETPFTGPSGAAILARKLEGRPRSIRVVRPTIPPRVEQVIRKALAATPADRYATAADFAKALERGGDGSRTLLRAAGGAALIVVAALAVWKLAHQSRRALQPEPNHLAVLYFEDRSDSGTLGPVANGLTEDLIDQLSRVQALTVITPGGVSQFRGSTISLDSIARALQVGTLVTGSVARSEDRLRVNIRLVDGASGQQLYHETITRPWGELLRLEDSLSADLAAFLRARLGETVQLRARRSGTRSVEAWKVLQQGDALRAEARTLLRKGEDDVAAKALMHQADLLYIQAGRLDTRWSVPIIERGRVAVDLAGLAPAGPVDGHERPFPNQDVEFGTLTSAEWLTRARQFGEDALALNADDPQAHALRGTARFRLWLDLYVSDAESVAAAERDLRGAVESDPLLARAWFELSELLRFTARFTEADWAARRALEADAYLAETPRVYYTLFYTALNRERFDEAQTWCHTGRAKYPEDPALRDCEVRILGWSARGRAQVARAWQLIADVENTRPDEQSGSLWADRRLLVAAMLARSGMADSAHALIRLARAGDSADSAAAWILQEEAYVRVLLHETDEAIRLLSRVVEAARQMRPYLTVSPWFASLHADPRFKALVAAP